MKRYSGRNFSISDLDVIHRILAHNPNANRAQLSRIVCKQLNWLNAQGQLKEMSCRVAMLRMQEDKLITLPPPKNKPPALSKKKIAHTNRTNSLVKISTSVGKIGELSLSLVIGRKDASIWNEYIDRYHYLGHKTLPGAQLRYFVRANQQLIACLGFGAAAWKTAPRDEFIGWTPEQREKNLHLIINNARLSYFALGTIQKFGFKNSIPRQQEVNQ